MEYRCASSPNNSPDTRGDAELATLPPEQFGGLYATYRPRIYCLCLRMTGNYSEAEDLTEDSFLRLFHKFGSFRQESSLYTWLRRLTINVVLLRFQKPGWHRETSLEGLAEPNGPAGEGRRREFGCVDCDLQAVLERIDLERALNRLPPGFRTVLIMHDIEGYGHGEISRLMGCSVGTSKSQLHKARTKMRGFLGGYRRGELVA